VRGRRGLRHDNPHRRPAQPGRSGPLLEKETHRLGRIYAEFVPEQLPASLELAPGL
jgi:hypothetical protein